MEIIKDFVWIFDNNNDEPWKSSRILRVQPQTLEIFENFDLLYFSCFEMFHVLFSFNVFIFSFLFVVFHVFQIFQFFF